MHPRECAPQLFIWSKAETFPAEQEAADCDKSPAGCDGQTGHHGVNSIATASATHGLSTCAARLTAAELFVILNDTYSTSAYFGSISATPFEFEDGPISNGGE